MDAAVLSVGVILERGDKNNKDFACGLGLPARRSPFSFIRNFRTMTYVYIAIFAIVGAFARYGQTLAVQGFLGRDFPFATLSINILGSFLMGFLFFETLERINLSPELRTGLLTGGLGAYTTFSTFSLESLNLIEGGELTKAALYVAASVVLSIAAAIFGAFLSRNLGVSA